MVIIFTPSGQSKQSQNVYASSFASAIIWLLNTGILLLQSFYGNWFAFFRTLKNKSMGIFDTLTLKLKQ